MKLWHKVILGLLLGIACGYLIGQAEILQGFGIDGKAFLTDYVKPVGTVFINLIRMVVVPLIFFSLIAGVTSMTDLGAFKRVGAKAVVAFFITCAFAVTIGLIFGAIFRPGEGADLTSLQTGKPVGAPVAAVASTSVVDMLVGMVPTNALKAMAEEHILQVVVFAVFVAVALNLQRDKVRDLITLCQQAAHVVFKMIEMVIQFSPYGVFALTAWVVGTQGADILRKLLTLVLVVYGAFITQYLFFGLMILVFARMSPVPFYKKMLEAQLLAIATVSSKATLPTAMRVVNERVGVSKANTSFVLPLGAAINMDGTAIYLGVCVLFFSQAYHIPIGPQHYLTLILTATLGSIGAAGIPGGSLIMLGPVLTSVGLPLEGIALVAGVDRIIDMLRTAVNITGDSLITLLVDKSEGTFDEKTYFDMTSSDLERR